MDGTTTRRAPFVRSPSAAYFLSCDATTRRPPTRPTSSPVTAFSPPMTFACARASTSGAVGRHH
eukprot:30873-Pelagococcus_subviridis.AAC.5